MHHQLCLPGICMLFKELCVLDVLHTYRLQNELAPLLEHQVQFPRLLNTALFKLLTCLCVSERACEFPTTWSLAMSCCSANCNATVSSSAWFYVLSWPSSLASICSILTPFLLPLFQLLIWELWPLTLPSCHPVQACKAHIVWRASFCSFHLQGAYPNTPKAFLLHVLHFVDCEVALLCKLLLHCCKNCCWVLPSSLLPKPWMRSSFLLALKLRFQASSPFRAHDDVPAELPIAERLDFRL